MAIYVELSAFSINLKCASMSTVNPLVPWFVFLLIYLKFVVFQTGIHPLLQMKSLTYYNWLYKGISTNKQNWSPIKEFEIVTYSEINFLLTDI